jgi:hypothetical protein
MSEWLSKIANVAAIASVPVLPWRGIIALSLGALYLSVDWISLVRAWYPAVRMHLFEVELQELEALSFNCQCGPCNVLLTHRDDGHIEPGIPLYAVTILCYELCY